MRDLDSREHRLESSVVVRGKITFPETIPFSVALHGIHTVIEPLVKEYFDNRVRENTGKMPELLSIGVADFFKVDYVHIIDNFIILHEVKYSKDGRKPYFVRGFYSDKWLYDKCHELNCSTELPLEKFGELPKVDLPQAYGSKFMRTASIVDQEGHLVMYLFDNTEPRLIRNTEYLRNLLKDKVAEAREAAEEKTGDATSRADEIKDLVARIAALTPIT